MKVISGGQTGVDRAAWDAAIEIGLPHSGFVPKGRMAEDGRIPNAYSAVETQSSDYALRTEMNVMAADATLILYRNVLAGGTRYTWISCKKHKKPACLIDLEKNPDNAFIQAQKFLKKYKPGILNVAGPRQSTSPGIYSQAKNFLTKLLYETRP